MDVSTFIFRLLLCHCHCQQQKQKQLFSSFLVAAMKLGKLGRRLGLINRTPSSMDIKGFMINVDLLRGSVGRVPSSCFSFFFFFLLKPTER